MQLLVVLLHFETVLIRFKASLPILQELPQFSLIDLFSKPTYKGSIFENASIIILQALLQYCDQTIKFYLMLAMKIPLCK